MDRNTFDIKEFGENPKGRSCTVPNGSLSLKEILRRSYAGMNIPNIAMPVDTGEDEDFEDAFSPDIDFADVYENSEKLGYYASLIEQAKKAKAKNNKTEVDSKPSGEELKVEN